MWRAAEGALVAHEICGFMEMQTRQHGIDHTGMVVGGMGVLALVAREVLEQLGNEIDVRQNHAAAAVTVQAQSVQSITRRGG